MENNAVHLLNLIFFSYYHHPSKIYLEEYDDFNFELHKSGIMQDVTQNTVQAQFVQKRALESKSSLKNLPTFRPKTLPTPPPLAL